MREVIGEPDSFPDDIIIARFGISFEIKKSSPFVPPPVVEWNYPVGKTIACEG